MVEMKRRAFIGGLIALVAAPAIVRTGSLMPVKAFDPSPAEIVALLERRIEAANAVLARQMNEMLYGDISVTGHEGQLLGLQALIQDVPSSSVGGISRYPFRQIGASIPVGLS